MSFTSDAPAAPPSLLRDRDYRIALSARSISLLGDEAAVVALTLRVTDRGAGAWAVSGLLMAGFLPLLLLAPFTGLLVDRTDSRRLLVTAGLAQAAVCFVLAGVSSTPAVLALVVALGCGQSVTGTTWSALMPDIAGPDRLAQATGYYQAAATVAGIAAPAVGGILTGIGGAGWVLTLDGLTFLALASAAVAVRHRRGSSAAADATGWRAGLTTIAADAVLAPLITLLGSFVLLAGMANVAGVFLIRHTLHAGAAWFGIEGAVIGAAMLVGSLATGRLRSVRALVRCALLATVAMSASLFGYALAPSVYWLMVPAVACGLGNGALSVSISTVIMMRAPESTRGRVAAAINAAVSAAMIGSMALGGLLAGVLTPRQLFAVAGIGTVVVPVAMAGRLARAVRAADRPLAPLVAAADAADTAWSAS